MYLSSFLYGFSVAHILIIFCAASSYPIFGNSSIPDESPVSCFLNNDWASPHWPIRVLRWFNMIYYRLKEAHQPGETLEFLPERIVPTGSLPVVWTPFKLVNGERLQWEA